MKGIILFTIVAIVMASGSSVWGNPGSEGVATSDGEIVTFSCIEIQMQKGFIDPRFNAELTESDLSVIFSGNEVIAFPSATEFVVHTATLIAWQKGIAMSYSLRIPAFVRDILNQVEDILDVLSVASLGSLGAPMNVKVKDDSFTLFYPMGRKVTGLYETCSSHYGDYRKVVSLSYARRGDLDIDLDERTIEYATCAVSHRRNFSTPYRSREDWDEKFPV